MPASAPGWRCGPARRRRSFCVWQWPAIVRSNARAETAVRNALQIRHGRVGMLRQPANRAELRGHVRNRRILSRCCDVGVVIWSRKSLSSGSCSSRYSSPPQDAAAHAHRPEREQQKMSSQSRRSRKPPQLLLPSGDQHVRESAELSSLEPLLFVSFFPN
jgi:hypothetical protein